MNIDQYRALVKAQAQQEESQSTEETTSNEEVVETTNQEETTQQQLSDTTDNVEQQVESKPDKIVVDGIGEVSLDELREWRNGYMRNADYTQKTQELARQRQELEQLRRQSQQVLTEGVQQQTQNLDPASRKISELENKLYDLIIDREVTMLQSEFPDFDAREVIPIAQQKGLNLRDAYLINKATKSISGGGEQRKEVEQPPTQQIDIDALTKEIIKKLEAERDSTTTIISSNDSPTIVTNDTPKLSPAELAFCQRQKIDPKEYAKWKEIKPRKG